MVQNIKLAEFADDMNSFLADVKSANRLFQLSEKFSIISGLNANKEKTKGIWLGSERHTKSEPLGIRWTSEPVKGLRVFYGYDEDKCKRINCAHKLDDL